MSRRCLPRVMATIALALASALTGCAAHPARKAASQSQPTRYTAELARAKTHARRIARKIDDKAPLTAEDWAQTRTMIASRDWRVRMRGLTVLEGFGKTSYAEQAWQLALKHLADPDPVGRIYAAADVGRMRPFEAAPHLRPLLQDPDEDVRQCVKQMLDEIDQAAQEP